MVNYTLDEVFTVKSEMKDFILNEDITKVLKRLTELLGVDTSQKSRYNKKDKNQNNEDIAWKNSKCLKRLYLLRKTN